MNFLERVKNTIETWWTPKAQKNFYRHGVPGIKYSGYEAGRLARRRALQRRVDRAQARLNKAQGKLDEFLEIEAARKDEAREKA